MKALRAWYARSEDSWWLMVSVVLIPVVAAFILAIAFNRNYSESFPINFAWARSPIATCTLLLVGPLFAGLQVLLKNRNANGVDRYTLVKSNLSAAVDVMALLSKYAEQTDANSARRAETRYVASRIAEMCLRGASSFAGTRAEALQVVVAPVRDGIISAEDIVIAPASQDNIMSPEAKKSLARYSLLTLCLAQDAVKVIPDVKKDDMFVKINGLPQDGSIFACPVTLDGQTIYVVSVFATKRNVINSSWAPEYKLSARAYGYLMHIGLSGKYRMDLAAVVTGVDAANGVRTAD